MTDDGENVEVGKKIRKIGVGLEARYKVITPRAHPLLPHAGTSFSSHAPRPRGEVRALAREGGQARTSPLRLAWLRAAIHFPRALHANEEIIPRVGAERNAITCANISPRLRASACQSSGGETWDSHHEKFNAEARRRSFAMSLALSRQERRIVGLGSD